MQSETKKYSDVRVRRLMRLANIQDSFMPASTSATRYSLNQPNFPQPSYWAWSACGCVPEQLPDGRRGERGSCQQGEGSCGWRGPAGCPGRCRCPGRADGPCIGS